MNRGLALLPTLLAVAALQVGCGFYLGDRGSGVAITNASAFTVTYFAEGVGERPDSAVSVGKQLAAGATDHDTWVIADGAKAKVYARNTSGALVYCRVFSKADLRAGGWRVLIEPGQIRC